MAERLPKQLKCSWPYIYEVQVIHCVLTSMIFRILCSFYLDTITSMQNNINLSPSVALNYPYPNALSLIP